MNTSDVVTALENTKALLSIPGVWTNRPSELDGFSPKHCLLTGLSECTGEEPWEVNVTARRHMRWALGTDHIAVWNDSHSLPEVLEGLDRAIELAKQEAPK